jgi:hypothetical protein
LCDPAKGGMRSEGGKGSPRMGEIGCCQSVLLFPKAVFLAAAMASMQLD